MVGFVGKSVASVMLDSIEYARHVVWLYSKSQGKLASLYPVDALELLGLEGGECFVKLVAGFG